MKAMAVAAILAGVAAAAAGAYAWMQHQDLAQTRSALNGANSELQKTRSDLTATQAELVALRKEFSEQQMALNQLQAEMANARAFVEAEKAISARLRAELARMKEEYATALRAGRGAPSRNPPAPPMLVREPQRPMVIRQAPGGASVGAPAAAR